MVVFKLDGTLGKLGLNIKIVPVKVRGSITSFMSATFKRRNYNNQGNDNQGKSAGLFVTGFLFWAND